MKLFVVVACYLVACAAGAPQDQPEVKILRQEFDQDESGSYRYAYELDNNVAAEEEGRVLPGPEPETGSLDVNGRFKFQVDGNDYSLSYRAGEGGFQPEGDHLPVAPAQIPEYAQLREEHPELFWAEQ